MCQIETWPRIPAALRDLLVERMHDRTVGLDQLNRLRVRLKTKPNVPRRSLVQRFRLVQTLRRGQVS